MFSFSFCYWQVLAWASPHQLPLSPSITISRRNVAKRSVCRWPAPRLACWYCRNWFAFCSSCTVFAARCSFLAAWRCTRHSVRRCCSRSSGIWKKSVSTWKCNRIRRRTWNRWKRTKMMSSPKWRRCYSRRQTLMAAVICARISPKWPSVRWTMAWRSGRRFRVSCPTDRIWDRMDCWRPVTMPRRCEGARRPLCRNCRCWISWAAICKCTSM